MAHQAPQFIGWSKSLAQGVATRLAEGQTGAPMDLGRHRVIVPSSFASRLIQEHLAKEAGGLLLPEFQTPDKFLNWGDSHVNVASKETCLLAWVEVLTSPHFSRTDFPALFPAESTPDFTFDEAKKFAEQLMQLRDQLGASRDGHDFAALAAVVETNPDRWNNLHRLELAYLNVLNRLGQRDHNQVRTELAKGDGMPEGVTDVWLVGLLEPQPLLLEALDVSREDGVDALSAFAALPGRGAESQLSTVRLLTLQARASQLRSRRCCLSQSLTLSLFCSSGIILTRVNEFSSKFFHGS
jgi:hypothetical protein